MKTYSEMNQNKRNKRKEGEEGMNDKVKHPNEYILPPERFYQSGKRKDYRAGVLYYLSTIARCVIFLMEHTASKESEE